MCWAVNGDKTFILIVAHRQIDRERFSVPALLNLILAHFIVKIEDFMERYYENLFYILLIYFLGMAMRIFLNFAVWHW